ncbi:MAG: CDP-alcohol phosphatidyltransferase family protein [Candidatus Nanopelagicales bacterium]
MGNPTQLNVANSNWTIPNALSGLRLLGVPVFFWLIVGPENDGLALAILIVSSFTDWLDGYLARRLNQFSRLGELLDPLADRLYVVAALAALYIRDLLPIWVVVLLILRDVLMSGLLLYLKRLGITGIPVHFVGKAATMNLLYALPLILLGTFSGLVGQLAHIFGWAFLIWGITMYWYAGALYYRQIYEMRRVRNAR